MLPIVSNEVGKVHLRAVMSQAATLGEMVASAGSGLRGLRVDLS